MNGQRQHETPEHHRDERALLATEDGPSSNSREGRSDDADRCEKHQALMCLRATPKNHCGQALILEASLRQPAKNTKLSLEEARHAVAIRSIETALARPRHHFSRSRA